MDKRRAKSKGFTNVFRGFVNVFNCCIISIVLQMLNQLHTANTLCQLIHMLTTMANFKMETKTNRSATSLQSIYLLQFVRWKLIIETCSFTWNSAWSLVILDLSLSLSSAIIWLCVNYFISFHFYTLTRPTIPLIFIFFQFFIEKFFDICMLPM